MWVGPYAKAAVAEMKDGDVILLENTRYRAEETKNGDEFSKELASLCDVFVNDAFGTAHRAVLDGDAVDGNGRAISEPGFYPVSVHVVAAGKQFVHGKTPFI